MGIVGLGKDNPNWRGGKTRCQDCNKELAQRYSHRDTKRCKPCWYKSMNKSGHPNWKGGVTPYRTAIWKSLEYQSWRNSVFQRDNYTCVKCGDATGNNLEADHIMPFSLFPSVRFDIDNGRTLCVDCHKQTHTFRGRCPKLIIFSSIYGLQ